MNILPYDRAATVEYAKKWAFRRNGNYYDFERIGGDCTNFASQCVYAGAKIMNYTPVVGWYYNSAADRAAAWTGVEYFYRFMISNDGVGPFAEEVTVDKLQLGDIVQLGRETGDFYHSPVVVGKTGGKIFVAAHSFDAYYRPLSSYKFEKIRGIHILGVRTDG